MDFDEMQRAWLSGEPNRLYAMSKPAEVFTRLTFDCTCLIRFGSPPPIPAVVACLQHRQGQVLPEGRKYPRTGGRFLVQVSSVRDPLLTEVASVENQSPGGLQLATARSWELGLHVDVKSVARNLTSLNARTRVVYCHAVGPSRFFVGLDILSRDAEPSKS